jgi:hypothetical protein
MKESTSWPFRAACAGARRFAFVALSLSLGLGWTTHAAAFDLPIEARVQNVGSYCTWASLDTLARANGIPKLCGVMEERRQQNESQPDPGYDEKIEEELKSRGVRYALRGQWSFERDLLEQYAATYGVAVSLMAGNPWSIGCHTIVITHYDEQTVEFYDSSKPVDSDQRPKIWRCGRGWFDQWWLGSSVVVFPNDATMEMSE